MEYSALEYESPAEADEPLFNDDLGAGITALLSSHANTMMNAAAVDTDQARLLVEAGVDIDGIDSYDFSGDG